jgi:hypothetical protein
VGNFFGGIPLMRGFRTLSIGGFGLFIHVF